jgi:hypothetical protein
MLGTAAAHAVRHVVRGEGAAAWMVVSRQERVRVAQ